MRPSLKSKGSRNQPVVLHPSLGGPGSLCLAAPHQKGPGLIRTFAGHGPLPLTNPPCSVEVCKYLSETRSGSRKGKVTLLPPKPCRGASLAYKHLSSWRAWQVPLSARMQQNAPSGPTLSAALLYLLLDLQSENCSIPLSLSLCSSTMFSLPPQPGKWGVKNLPRSPI